MYLYSGSLLCGCVLNTQAIRLWKDKTVHGYARIAHETEQTVYYSETNAPSFQNRPETRVNQSEEILQLRSEDWDKAQCLAFDIYYGEILGHLLLRAYAKGESKVINAVVALYQKPVTFPRFLETGKFMSGISSPERSCPGQTSPLEELERLNHSAHGP